MTYKSHSIVIKKKKKRLYHILNCYCSIENNNKNAFSSARFALQWLCSVKCKHYSSKMMNRRNKNANNYNKYTNDNFHFAYSSLLTPLVDQIKVISLSFVAVETYTDA